MKVRMLSRAQILQKFHLHCQSLAANSNAGFRQEFEELTDVGREFSCRAGELDANRQKNRYPFILPYDHCRVRLSLLASEFHSDYINASYVPGGGSEHDFICTQAPLRATMSDFWRMIWEQKVQVIVMVTALRENGKVLCDQYWPPERGTGCYGEVQVTTVVRRRGPECYITTIHLRHHGSPTERRVTHYHFPGWPDQGVPRNTASLCAFTEHVRQHLDTVPRMGPTVVHCSAGVGRSGTFVTLLWLLQLSARGIPPDVRTAVEDLRRHRVMMVQNLEQYIFIHHCLLHCLSGGNAGPQLRTQNAQIPAGPAPHRGQSRQSRRGSRERRRSSDAPSQPEFTHSSTTGAPSSQAQPTALQSLQSTFQTLHPGKLLRRILPPSMQLNNTHNNTHDTNL